MEAPAACTDFPRAPPLLLCLLQQEWGACGDRGGGEAEAPRCVGSEVPAGFVLTLRVWQSAPRGQGGRDGAQTMRADWPETQGLRDLGAADS